MRNIAILTFVTFALLCAHAQKSEKPYRPNYSKYASSGSSLDHHKRHSGDYSALTSASASQKKMDSELKKLEAQSNHVQTSSAKSPKVRPVPLKTAKVNEKTAAINFQSKPAKTKMTANKTSGPSRSRGGSHGHMGVR